LINCKVDIQVAFGTGVLESVSQSEKPTSPNLYEQVLSLRQDLQIRDQLVQQLSEELFRLIKQPSPLQTEADFITEQSQYKQLQAAQQLDSCREEINRRDIEIAQLQASMQDLSERNFFLEQLVQELPEVYRQRFAARLTPIRQKLAMLQQENRQLHAKLESVSYRLAVKTRFADQVELPNLSEFSKPD